MCSKLYACVFAGCVTVNASKGMVFTEAELRLSWHKVPVSIEVDDSEIEGRMTGRRVCGKCGASYHVIANPSKVEGVCDSCGGELIIRKDDKPETVRHRLEVYHASTEVLKGFYEKLGRLVLVNGSQSIEGANEEILKAIGAKV